MKLKGFELLVLSWQTCAPFTLTVNVPASINCVPKPPLTKLTPVCCESRRYQGAPPGGSALVGTSPAAVVVLSVQTCDGLAMWLVYAVAVQPAVQFTSVGEPVTLRTAPT